jgi:hypothetical protein
LFDNFAQNYFPTGWYAVRIAKRSLLRTYRADLDIIAPEEHPSGGRDYFEFDVPVNACGVSVGHGTTLGLSKAEVKQMEADYKKIGQN